jgi:hypothetical protein
MQGRATGTAAWDRRVCSTRSTLCPVVCVVVTYLQQRVNEKLTGYGNKAKGKAVPLHAMKALGGGEV